MYDTNEEYQDQKWERFNWEQDWFIYEYNNDNLKDDYYYDGDKFEEE